MKDNRQHSHHDVLQRNRQDEQGLCAELPANGGFDSSIGLRVFHAENRVVCRTMPADTERGRYVAPDIRGCTSASRPVNQLIFFQQTDGDAVGVGDAARPQGD